MSFNSDIHHRRSIRLPGYDYASENAYFVTICTRDRQCLFGDIVDGEIRLSEVAKIIQEEWYKTPFIRPEIKLDEFVVMPNHFHGIVWITKSIGCSSMGRTAVTPLRRQPKSLFSFIAQFKATVTCRIRTFDQSYYAIWQRNYYERIIRSDCELYETRKYIIENIHKWAFDHENPHVGASRLCAPSKDATM